jgi:hypothetical protein
MDLSTIAQHRLFSQQLARHQFDRVQDLVAWMGAIQAQDFAWAKWAVGIRLPGATEQLIETAISHAQIIRTHLLRPTWHFVAAGDIYWLLDLTAAQIKTAMRSNDRLQGLSDFDFVRCNALIETALRDGSQLTRLELIDVLKSAGIDTGANRPSHIFAHAELDGIICSGATRKGKITYALLASRVPKPPAISEEEALARLAQRYFTSHAPATLQDFTWWSGLPARKAARALDLVKSAFISETIDRLTYWLPGNFSPPRLDPEQVYLLPAYDEFLISYNDRRASLPAEVNRQTVSSNGIFYPVILLDGVVVGTWKRTTKKDHLALEMSPYQPLQRSTLDRITAAAGQYGRFSGKEIEIGYPR